MSRPSPFGHPFLLGFDEIEQALERVAKSTNDGYPPYNIERIAQPDGSPGGLRITVAVAGFMPEDLDVRVEDNHLVVKGRQTDEASRTYLHRGIAARQFQRVFLLADGMQVSDAHLAHGLLHIDVTRPEPESRITRIPIRHEA